MQEICEKKIIAMKRKNRVLLELKYRTSRIHWLLTKKDYSEYLDRVCRTSMESVYGGEYGWTFSKPKIARRYRWEMHWKEWVLEEMDGRPFGGKVVSCVDDGVRVFTSKTKKRKEGYWRTEECCEKFPFCVCDITHDPYTCPDEFCERCAIMLCPSGDSSHLSEEGCPTCRTMEEIRAHRKKFLTTTTSKRHKKE